MRQRSDGETEDGGALFQRMGKFIAFNPVISADFTLASPPERLAAQVKSDIARWAPLVKAAGIKFK